MPLLRYFKVLLQTPGTGSVLICFVGLALSAALAMHWRHSNDGLPHRQEDLRHASAPSPSANSTAGSPLAAVGLSANPRTVAPHPAHIRVPVQQSAPESRAEGTSATAGTPTARRREAIFEPAGAAQLSDLSAYAGEPASEAIQERGLRDSINEVVPYAPFHLGLDMPLPRALEAALSRSSLPIELRDGRYVLISSNGGGRGPRGFLWIDTKKGIAIGGIFFHPSNGEPTPTLTLFSRQATSGFVRFSQLPAVFIQTLNQWSAGTGIPAITTRYFINASGEKFVLKHDEDFCKSAEGQPSSAAEACEKMNADAAGIDLQASLFLRRTHYASNATMRMVTAQSGIDGIAVR